MLCVAWMNEYISVAPKGLRDRGLDQHWKKIPVALRPDHCIPISKSFLNYQSNKIET